MDSVIQKLDPEEFPLCANIWNMKRHWAMAEQFYRELLCQNRITFVYKADGAFVGEISLYVFNMQKKSDILRCLLGWIWIITPR